MRLQRLRVRDREWLQSTEAPRKFISTTYCNNNGSKQVSSKGDDFGDEDLDNGKIICIRQACECPACPPRSRWHPGTARFARRTFSTSRYQTAKARRGGELNIGRNTHFGLPVAYTAMGLFIIPDSMAGWRE